MDELQRENLKQKTEIYELQSGNDGLAVKLKLCQENVSQLELQLQQKEELVRMLWCYYTVTYVRAVVDIKL